MLERLSGGKQEWVTPEDAFEYAAIKMAFWGGVENFAILLSMTIMIEILKQRLLYIVLLTGIVGFFFAGIIGTVVGLAIGMVFFLTYRFKLHEKNVLARFWSYLWEKNDRPIS